jgi:hypothetical protein
MTEKTLAKYHRAGPDGAVRHSAAGGGHARGGHRGQAARRRDRIHPEARQRLQRREGHPGGEPDRARGHRDRRGRQADGGESSSRVNAAVTDGIAKYHALGQQAPAELLKLQEATKAIPPIPDPSVAFKKQPGRPAGDAAHRSRSGLRTAGRRADSAAVTVPIVAAGAAVCEAGRSTRSNPRASCRCAFGDMRASDDAWSKDLSASLGLNQFEMRKMAGVLFTMTTGMGLGRQAAFDMSTGNVEAGRGHGVVPQHQHRRGVQQAAAPGITGETEPLKAARHSRRRGHGQDLRLQHRDRQAGRRAHGSSRRCWPATRPSSRKRRTTRATSRARWIRRPTSCASCRPGSRRPRPRSGIALLPLIQRGHRRADVARAGGPDGRAVVRGDAAARAVHRRGSSGGVRGRSARC